MAESFYGLQAAIAAINKLQDERHEANQLILSEIRADVKALTFRQDQTDEVIDIIRTVFSRKNITYVGGVVGAATFVATLLARLFS